MIQYVRSVQDLLSLGKQPQDRQRACALPASLEAVCSAVFTQGLRKVFSLPCWESLAARDLRWLHQPDCPAAALFPAL